jgi:hypothetical protein
VTSSARRTSCSTGSTRPVRGGSPLPSARGTASAPAGSQRRRPVYEVVRVLGRSGFIDQWATYLDEPVDALVERADAELRARLDAV